MALIPIFLLQYRRQTKEEEAARSQMGGALLVNGEAPTSPSHSSHSLQGSQNISFADPASPAGSPTKRNYILAKSLPNSPDQPNRGNSGFHSPQGPAPNARSPTGPYPAAPGSPHKTGPKDLPSPYFMNAKPTDYIHDRDSLGAARHPNKCGHKGHRKSGSSPDRRNRHSRSMSPMQLSQTSSPPSTVSSRPPVPLADMEDLSPTTPTSELPPINPPRGPSEDIPLNSYGASHPAQPRGVANTHLTSPRTDPRPPVEGRDSKHYTDNGRGKIGARPKMWTPWSRSPTTPDKQNANYIPSSPSDSGRNKPDLKPLPLRHVQRPDGQSPDYRGEDQNANSSPSHASVTSHELSPVLRHTKLFPESSSRTPSEDLISQPDFEYDDYIPTIPGSVFNMDPGAYTLTWSQQQTPWTGASPGKTKVNNKDSTPSRESHA